MKKYIILIFILLFCISANAATIYVDNNTTDCTNNYSIVSRNCSGSDGDSYDTIQEAVDAVGVGDVIYMRGDTYTDAGVVIPQATAGTSWDEGDYTTLASYPGEWAILNGGNSGARDAALLGTGLSSWDQSENLAYWKFERFEITGDYSNGIWTAGGPQWFRYLYIHGLSNSGAEDIRGGIVSMGARHNIIEYCVFASNGTGSGGNAGHIIFDADQKDSADSAFVPGEAPHSNIIRYNYFYGSTDQGIRLKGDQRFGYNNRDPRSSNATLWQYKTYGDNIHHNIIEDTQSSIMWGQDFSWIHHNIVTGNIEALGKKDGHPVLYNQVVNNNTAVGANTMYYFRSAADETGYANYYDVSGDPVAHVHFWGYNNIISGSTISDPPAGFRIMYDTANDNWDASDVYFDGNLVHNLNNSEPYRMGNTATGTGCEDEYYTASTFNSCLSTWNEPGTNYDQDNSLFTSGYLTDGSFAVDGASTTITDGGVNIAHPYLSGESIPAYIGATNPDDNEWVAGVLALDTTYFTNAEAGSDPTWIEGATPPTYQPSTSISATGATIQ
jgi:signal peptidase I